MSKKYSSDDGMQKLFESFRRSLNENEAEANEALNLKGSSAPKKGLNLMRKQSGLEKQAASARAASKGLDLDPDSIKNRLARIKNMSAAGASIDINAAVRALSDIQENPELQQDPDMARIYDTILAALNSKNDPTEEDAAALAQGIKDLELRKQALKQAKMQSLE